MREIVKPYPEVGWWEKLPVKSEVSDWDEISKNRTAIQALTLFKRSISSNNLQSHLLLK